eukprot:8199655-Alexandrium_andersonii.AAC.1
MQPPRHSGSFHVDAERFGSHLTCDFIASKLDHMAGIHGARDVFVVKDIYSGLCHAFATKSRHENEVIECMKLLSGGRIWDIRKMYSDNAPEIIAAMREFHILRQHSQPGISKENAVAERANRDVLEMTRAALVQGGLPACFWTEAAPCVTFHSN